MLHKAAPTMLFFYYLDLKEIRTEEVWESAVVSETRRVRTYETRFLSVWLLIKKGLNSLIVSGGDCWNKLTF